MTDHRSGSSGIAARLRELEGAPPVLQLPADRARPASLGQVVARCTTSWSSPMAQELAVLARASGASAHAVLLAAWLTMLARYSDETDLVIGCRGLGGGGQDDDGSVHIMRRQLRFEDPFQLVITQTAQALQEGITAGPVGVSELLDAIGATPAPGKHPIFQVAFAAGADALGPLSDASEPCDLALHWADAEDGGITLQLDYTPALFDRVRVEQMLAHLEVLLRSAIDAPHLPIATLPLLTPEDHSHLRRWNDTAEPHDADRPMAALFASQVERTPEAIAVELGEVRLTYRELDRRADRLASALQARGVGPDVPVAVSLERSVEQVIAVLAVLKAGGAYVPIDVNYPEARRTFMLENSRAAVLVVAEGMETQLTDAAVSEVLEVDGEERGDPVAHGSVPSETQVTGDHLGYVVYTSGSTGQPKGVALPQAAMTNLIEWQLRRKEFEPASRTLQFASLSFDVSFQEIFSTWCSGGTLVLIGDAIRRDPVSLLDHIIRFGVQRVFLPFVALRGLAHAAVTAQRFPTTLREVYTAGEQLQVDDVVRAFFTALPHCLLENQYGPSESHVVTAQPLDGPADSWPALPSIGSPIANSRIHILDARGELVPPGIPGELHIGGVCLAREYLGRPDLTADRFIPPSQTGEERVYRTGDLGRWREDGTIEFLGRTDNQVKFRGFRIEPGEVGAVLSGFPGVRQCVAQVVDVAGGARLAAYVLPADRAHVDLAELHRFARDRLPEYMVPSHVLVVDAFPLTPSGKIDLQQLPTPEFDRRILGADHVAPRSEEETALAGIWGRLLGIDGIGIHDDFFDLGGDSLMAVEMFAIVAERFGTELPLGALAQDPTIAGLSKHLTDDAETTERWSPLVPLQEVGSQTPLFCVHGGSGNVASFPKLARELPDRPVYALQWDGLDGGRGARTLHAMADRYLHEVRLLQPEGPYLFAGQCVGGLIAREMAHTLLEQGEEVGLLVMYDSPNVDSPTFRIARGLPPVPNRLRPLSNRLIGLVVEILRYLKGSRPRGPVTRALLFPALRRRLQSEDRPLHGTLVMLLAVWRHRIRPLDVPTLLIHTGQTRPRGIGMVGSWIDGMMGWSGHAGSWFEAHVVPGDHNGLPYQPASVRLLTDRLSSSDATSVRGKP